MSKVCTYFCIDMMFETGIINIDIRSMGNLAKNMVFHGLVQQVEHNKSHFFVGIH